MNFFYYYSTKQKIKEIQLNTLEILIVIVDAGKFNIFECHTEMVVKIASFEIPR